MGPLFLTMSLIFFLFSCAGKKNLVEGKLLLAPKYELGSIRFVEVDFQKVSLEINLMVSNPNYIPLNFSKVTYSLFLDKEHVLQAELSEGIQIPATNSVEIVIPLEVQLSALSMGAVNFMINRKVTYDFELLMYPDIPILEKKSFKRQRSGILSF